MISKYFSVNWLSNLFSRYVTDLLWLTAGLVALFSDDALPYGAISGVVLFFVVAHFVLRLSVPGLLLSEFNRRKNLKAENNQ